MKKRKVVKKEKSKQEKPKKNKKNYTIEDLIRKFNTKYDK